MEKVNLPDMEKGRWKIERFTADRMDWSSWQHGRAVPVGESFTRLMRGNTLVMSDTQLKWMITEKLFSSKKLLSFEWPGSWSGFEKHPAQKLGD